MERRRYLIFSAGIVGLIVVALAMVSGLQARSASQSAAVSPDQAVDQSAARPSDKPSADPSTPASDPQGNGKPAAPAAPQATGANGQALPVQSDVAIPSYQDVPLNDTVTVEGRVVARIVSVTPTASDGRGPGEIDGPAVAVTVELRNASGQTVKLNTAGVTVSLGPDMIPASPLPTQSLAEPFNGELENGKSATGTYVFLVPEGSPQDLRIEVTFGGDIPLIVFAGPRP